MSVIPPATLEGWYALHQILEVDWLGLGRVSAEERAEGAGELRGLFEEWADLGEEGWSASFALVGGGADLMAVHFRPTLDALAAVQRRLHRAALGGLLRTAYDFTSITEAGLYYATAEAAAQAKPGTEEFERIVREAAEAELASAHIRTRLYPRIPEGMRYASFYPMTKRRVHGDNWYSLPIAERNRLMREHGLTGRRYAKRVFQVISGSVGFDDWEWGVTLFARDPLEFKRIVTEMRYDEASARYGEFGSFYVGVRMAPDDWSSLLAEA